MEVTKFNKIYFYYYAVIKLKSVFDTGIMSLVRLGM